VIALVSIFSASQQREAHAVAQLRFVSGHRFSDAVTGQNKNGFSRWITRAAAKANRTLPRRNGTPEGMP
jgi:hypothetical protein